MSVFSPDSGSIELVSDAEAQMNLDSAKQLAAFQLGIPDTRNMDLSTRLQYNNLLANIILRYPDRFTEQMHINAVDSVGSNFQELSDDSYNWHDFGNMFIDNALTAANEGLGSIGRGTISLAASLGRALGGAGKAVENTANAAKWLVPIVAALAFVGFAATRTPINYSKFRK